MTRAPLPCSYLLSHLLPPRHCERPTGARQSSKFTVLTGLLRRLPCKLLAMTLSIKPSSGALRHLLPEGEGQAEPAPKTLCSTQDLFNLSTLQLFNLSTKKPSLRPSIPLVNCNNFLTKAVLFLKFLRKNAVNTVNTKEMLK
jgi:hypothetical protein